MRLERETERKRDRERELKEKSDLKEETPEL